MLKKYIALIAIVMIVIIFVVAPLFYSQLKANLSAYDNEFSSVSHFRTDLEVEYGEDNIRSIVSSPSLLNNLVEPENTLYIAIGIEREYTDAEIRAIEEFVQSGGKAIIAGDFDHINKIADPFGVIFYEGRFYDQQFDHNKSFTVAQAKLGTDLASWDMNAEGVQYQTWMAEGGKSRPDGVWDDDQDGDGLIDEDPPDEIDNDEDNPSYQNDGIDNDHDWTLADDLNGSRTPDAGENNVDEFLEGYDEDPNDDDGDGRIDEESLNGIDDDGDGLIDEDLRSYNLILDQPTGIHWSYTESTRVICNGSVNSFIDMNKNGQIDIPDPSTKTIQKADIISSPGRMIQLIVEVVDQDVIGDGKIIFIADSGLFINNLYDLDHQTHDDITGQLMKEDDPRVLEDIRDVAEERHPEDSLGEGGDDNNLMDNTPDGEPDYDNARFLKDLVYYMIRDDDLSVPDNVQIVFDESRHAQENRFLINVYKALQGVAILTSDLIFVITLSIVFLVVFFIIILTTGREESWIHRFNLKTYKGRSSLPSSRGVQTTRIRRSILEKVRMARGLSPEEFSEVDVRDIDRLIKDPILVDFVRNTSKTYTESELQAIIKQASSLDRV